MVDHSGIFGKLMSTYSLGKMAKPNHGLFIFLGWIEDELRFSAFHWPYAWNQHEYNTVQQKDAEKYGKVTAKWSKCPGTQWHIKLSPFHQRWKTEVLTTQVEPVPKKIKNKIKKNLTEIIRKDKDCILLLPLKSYRVTFWHFGFVRLL